LVFEPVRNPIEMAFNWVGVEKRLREDPMYPELYFKAFGSDQIDSVSTSKAIAQYLRTLVSFGSKFDKYLRKELDLTPQELQGLSLIMTEEGGDCFHCHTAADRLFGTNIMHNNGLDFDHQFNDYGFELVTGNPADRAKFKTPSLRNIMLTAPYMHDGRFETIDEVLMHYIQGGKPSSTVDPLMKHVGKGLELSINDVNAIKAFLHTLTDSTFIMSPKHRL
jgi:cytochrome c peroxidase